MNNSVPHQLVDDVRPCTRRQVYRPGRRVRVGAVDTFCGNLGARLAAGQDLVVSAPFANAAAALAVTHHGGAPVAPTAQEVSRYLAALCALCALCAHRS